MRSWAAAADVREAHASPTYARRMRALAERPVHDVPERPLVVLAAVRRAHFEGRAADPSLGDEQALRDDLPALTDELQAAVERGLVQLNEPLRMADMLAGLLIASRWYPGRPLRVLELGSSAGLLLLMSVTAVTYPTGRWIPPEAHGTLDSPLPVPQQLLDTPLSLESALGVDLNPIDVTDPASAQALRSFVWPDVPAREDRLAAALDVARARPPALVRASLPDALDDLLGDVVAPDAITVVFDSAFSDYTTLAAQRRMGATIDRAAGRGPLVLLTRGGVGRRPGEWAQVRAVDVSGRRRVVYANADLLSERCEWIGPREW
jgi:hypothetical protein